MPAIRQGIYRQANDQIVKYSESMASQGAELSKAQNAAEASGSEVEQTEELNKVLSEQNDTFRYLLPVFFILSSVIMFVLLCRSDSVIGVDLKAFHIDPHVFRVIIRIGIPSGLHGFCPLDGFPDGVP